MSRVILKERQFEPTGKSLGSFEAKDLETFDIQYTDSDENLENPQSDSDKKPSNVPQPLDDNPLEREDEPQSPESGKEGSSSSQKNQGERDDDQNGKIPDKWDPYGENLDEQDPDEPDEPDALEEPSGSFGDSNGSGGDSSDNDDMDYTPPQPQQKGLDQTGSKNNKNNYDEDSDDETSNGDGSAEDYSDIDDLKSNTDSSNDKEGNSNSRRNSQGEDFDEDSSGDGTNGDETTDDGTTGNGQDDNLDSNSNSKSKGESSDEDSYNEDEGDSNSSSDGNSNNEDEGDSNSSSDGNNEDEGDSNSSSDGNNNNEDKKEKNGQSGSDDLSGKSTNTGNNNDLAGEGNDNEINMNSSDNSSSGSENELSSSSGEETSPNFNSNSTPNSSISQASRGYDRFSEDPGESLGDEGVQVKDDMTYDDTRSEQDYSGTDKVPSQSELEAEDKDFSKDLGTLSELEKALDKIQESSTESSNLRRDTTNKRAEKESKDDSTPNNRARQDEIAAAKDIVGKAVQDTNENNISSINQTNDDIDYDSTSGDSAEDILSSLGAGNLTTLFNPSTLSDWRARLTKLFDKALGFDIVSNPNLVNKKIEDAPPGREDEIPVIKNVIILLDLSGSMGSTKFKQVISHVNTMLKARKMNKTWFHIIGFGSSELSEIEPYYTKCKGSQFKEKIMSGMYREGKWMTDLIPGIILAATKVHHPDAIIIMTDAEFNGGSMEALKRNSKAKMFMKKYKNKIIWALTYDFSKKGVQEFDPTALSQKRYVRFKNSKA